MSPPRYIVVHHAAAPRSTTVAEIHRWHVAGRGWRDIGYHRLIRMGDGEMVQTLPGRPFDADADWEPWEFGAHVAGHNAHAVGVCLVMDTTKERIPDAMWSAAIDCIADLCEQFGLAADAVRGHREMSGAVTTCPGDIDLDAFRVEVAAELRIRQDAAAGPTVEIPP